jgi:hypothetical protein
MGDQAMDHLPSDRAHTAEALATPYATARTDGIRFSAQPGVTTIRLSSGRRHGLAVLAENTPAISPHTPAGRWCHDRPG